MVEFNQEVYDLRPWYHDFAALGVQTCFPEGFTSRLWQMLSCLRRMIQPGYVEKGEKFSLRQFLNPRPLAHQTNQSTKEAYLLPFIAQAFDTLGTTPTCLDLFCADGYYSFHMARLRPEATITGVDLDAREIERARLMARLLGAANATFHKADVWEFVRDVRSYDLVFCTGGLYHLREPRRFVEQLVPLVGRHLIVQSVVTLETEDPDYFVSPAPGWQHGSRFTHAGLYGWIKSAGWDIVADACDELPGNTRLCDRGSSYFLCSVRS